MIQLAIECSGLHGSVALLAENRLIDAISLPTNRSSVQSLATTVKALLSQHGRRPQFISVTHGPGSFTGLRVGLTTAKMLGLAWQIPLVAVDTLEVIALQIHHRQTNSLPNIVVPVINAFRRQVFMSTWLNTPDSSIIPRTPQQVIEADVWIKQPIGMLPPCSFTNNLGDNAASIEYSLAANEILVGGPGLQNYQPESICQNSGLPVRQIHDVTPESKWVGLVGWSRFQAGTIESPETLSANYVRASAAEEKLDK